METCSNDESHVREMKVDHKRTNRSDRAKQLLYVQKQHIDRLNALLKYILIGYIIYTDYHQKT